jgi:hypothetical protein
MWIDGTTKSLQVVLAAPKTTNDCPISTDYTTTATAMTGQPLPANDSSKTTNGTTAVTIIGTQTSGNITGVSHLTVFNADTVATTMTIQMLNSTGPVTTIRIQVILQVGETFQYLPGQGFFVTDVNGNRK